jgi:hypothetical protein
MSDEEDERLKATVAAKFLDKILDQLIEAPIWPWLFVLPPVDNGDKLEHTLTQAELNGHIRQMYLLRQVCRG